MKSKPKAKKGSKSPSASRRKVVAVTHGPFCLDGMASAVCLGRFYGPKRVEPIFTHPSDVDRVIEEIADSIAKSAVDMASHASRKTVKGEDVKLASKPFNKF